MKALIAWLLCSSAASAGLLNIVATGDSIPTGFAPVKLTLAMQAQGVTGTGYAIASGGNTSGHYVGDLLDTNHHPGPSFHNQAVDAINGPVYGFGAPWTYGSVIEPNPEPDAVLVMLGTNDAIQTAAGNTGVWVAYQAKMLGVYQYLAAAVTPGGKRPDIFISTPLLIVAPEYAAADEFISTTMAPWIRQQVADLQGQGLAVHLIDVNERIRQQVGWTDWYNDGVHLFAAGGAGYTWLAETVLHAVLDQHMGDANLDGAVDELDRDAWSERLNQTGNWSQGDFNHDGIVDGIDYTLWADNCSPVSAAQPVPEPSSFALALLAALGLLALVRR